MQYKVTAWWRLSVQFLTSTSLLGPLKIGGSLLVPLKITSSTGCTRSPPSHAVDLCVFGQESCLQVLYSQVWCDDHAISGTQFTRKGSELDKEGEIHVQSLPNLSMRYMVMRASWALNMLTHIYWLALQRWRCQTYRGNSVDICAFLSEPVNELDMVPWLHVGKRVSCSSQWGRPTHMTQKRIAI